MAHMDRMIILYLWGMREGRILKRAREKISNKAERRLTLHIGLTATLPGTHSEKASDPFSLVVGASSSAPRLGETRRLPPPVLHFQPVGERLQGDNVLTSASPGPWQVHGQFLRLDFSQVAAGFEVETILEHCCIFDR